MRLTFNKLPLMGATAAVLLGGLASAQSDDCATATAAITGANPYDCAGATTGAEQPSPHTINNDIWFEWTADFTGDLEASLCDASADTILAVYDGTGCPAGGDEIAYNDDNSSGCGSFGPSLVNMTVVSGNVYTFQVGAYYATGFPAGNLVLTDVTPPPLSADDCATPDSRVGAGVFDFDTTAATDSGAGTTCNSATMNNDIWFEWTSDFTGICEVTTCDDADYDTKLAVYQTGVCPPTTSEQIACNDDDGSCSGYTSTMYFFATSGETYLVAIGGWNSSEIGTGNVTFSDASPAPTTNDDCAAPQAISGLGLINVDTSAATDSGAGSSCNSSLHNDVWLLWTADFDGDVKVSTCNLATYDTNIAAYSGTAACPPSLADEVACSDDASGCAGYSSEMTFTCVNGTSYLIGIGGYGSSSTGTTWVEFSDVTYIPPCTEDSYEDNDDCLGAIAAPLGLTTGLYYAGPLAPPPGEDNDFWSATVAPGETINVDIYFTNANGDTDLFLYDANGGFCGVGYDPSTNLDYGYTASDDESVSWFNNTGVSVDVIWEVKGYTSVECQTYDMNVSITDAIYTVGCLGDGSHGPCPCGNESAVGDNEGCLHGGGIGAQIYATGSNVVVNDDLVLHMAQAPATEPCLLFQGSYLANFPFADGLYCIGSPSVRIMPVLTTDASGDVATTVSIATAGNVLAGQTRQYQWVFRDGASGGACGAALNFSPAAEVIWQ